VRLKPVCFLALAGLIVAAAAANSATASRAPTYLERVTIMDAFNVPGRSWASKCVLIEVSTADARYALVSSPSKPAAACVRAGQVGNGFVLLLRSTATSLRWRNIFEGSFSPPCSLPQAVRRDLLGSTRCG